MGVVQVLAVLVAHSSISLADGSDTATATTVEVPAGEFWMGCNQAVEVQCAEPEKSGRKVVVGAYRIDRTEADRPYKREI